MFKFTPAPARDVTMLSGNGLLKGVPCQGQTSVLSSTRSYILGAASPKGLFAHRLHKNFIKVSSQSLTSFYSLSQNAGRRATNRVPQKSCPRLRDAAS